MPTPSGTRSGAGRTVPGVLGETYTFPAPPERVFGDLDVVASLGVAPVGAELFAEAEWAPYQLEVLDTEATTTVRYTDGPNIEAIAATRPDLILTAFADEALHRRLRDIAPTVYVDNTRPWREVVRAAAVPLFREQEAERAIEGVEEDFARFRAEHPERARSTPAVLYLGTDDTVTVLTAGSAMDAVLQDLGFGPLLPAGDPFGEQVSLELLADQAQGDFALVLVGGWRLSDPEEPLPARVRDLLGDPLVRAAPAVQAGVHLFPDEGGRAGYYYSPLYLPTFVDLLDRALAEPL
jgi:ABC-type Fe3+-hydroxamate transport system substrate-binding protein